MCSPTSCVLRNVNEVELLKDLSDACHRVLNDQKEDQHPELVAEMRETCQLVEERVSELGVNP